MIHLTMNQLSAYLDGQLRESSTELVRRHLEMCEECTGQFAALSKQEEVLVRVLVRDPGEGFLERLERKIGVATPPSPIAVAAAKPDRRTKPAPLEKAARPKEPGRPEKAARPEKPARPEKAARPEKPPHEERRVEPPRSERRVIAEEPKRLEEPAPPAKPPARVEPAPTPAEPPQARVESTRPTVEPAPAPVELAATKADLPPAKVERAAGAVERAPKAVEPASRAVDQAPAAVERVQPTVERAAAPARRARPPVRGRHQPAVPWFIAVLLALLVGAIGYVLPRAGRFAGAVDGTSAPHRAETNAEPVEPAKLHKSRSKALEAERTAPATQRVATERAATERAATERVAAADERSLPAEAEVPGAPPTKEPAAPMMKAPAVPKPAPDVARAVLQPPTAGQSPSDRSDERVSRRDATTDIGPARQPAISNSSRFGGRPSVAEARPDVFASIPAAAKPFVAAARRAAQAAAADSSAAKLDAAADAWERAISALDPAHRLPAQRNLAEARFQAWLTAPDGYRAAAATAALRTYLVFAPAGTDRDLARALLARVQRG